MWATAAKAPEEHLTGHFPGSLPLLWRLWDCLALINRVAFQCSLFLQLLPENSGVCFKGALGSLYSSGFFNFLAMKPMLHGALD